MDFEFERLGGGARPASHASVTFEINGLPMTATTPEAFILLQLLQEIRELRKELRSSDNGDGSHG